MSGLSRFGAKAVISLHRLQLEEAFVLGFFGGTRGGVVSFSDPRHLRKINMTFAMEIFPRVIISELMFG